MRVSTLVCDWCRHPRADNAVVTVRLKVDRRAQSDRRGRGEPHVDLCDKHLEALGELFRKRPRSTLGALRTETVPERVVGAIEYKREADRARHQKKAKPPARSGVRRTFTPESFAKNREKWARVNAERDQEILACLRMADKPIQRPAIDKAAGLRSWQTTPALRALVRRGLVVRHGAGPHSVYVLAQAPDAAAG